MAAQLVRSSRRAVLGSQGIADHDGVIPALGGKKVVERGQMGVAAVADHLSVNVPHPQGRSHQSGLAVVVGRHAVVHVGHGGRAVGDAEERLLVGG